MKQGKNPRKPLIFYYLIVMVIMTLLNAFVFPAMMNMSVTEVGYNNFRQLVEDGKVKAVEIGDDYVAFVADVETMDGETREGIFKTGLVDDPGLNDRLYEAGVSYAKVIPTESSPIISFLTSWIFPLIIFIGLGRLLTNMMQKKGGGPGAMQFGKSNAKVYVEAQTGKTFDDVAGQDEAKEALK
ncbi:MAG: ATP-dependent metallopeptidase FtsH/Yme1/Tma family protein, partial [Clostridia bacterium]|nr:ATP-dependent metallopeptidase FtsH/Yme1/Tma family protein [Clostridia bacterium]